LWFATRGCELFGKLPSLLGTFDAVPSSLLLERQNTRLI
jgi:hypothetical protein